MTGVNSYKNSKTSDYLDAIRKNIQENKNANTASRNYTPTFIKRVTSQCQFANTATVTEKTLQDYEITDNSGKQVAFLPFDLTVEDAMNDNHGTVTGTEQYTDSKLISDTTPLRKAFLFDGSSYILLDNESNFDFEYNQAFSIPIRVLLSDISADVGIVVKSNDLGVGVGIKLYYETSSGFFVFKLSDGTNEYEVKTTTTIRANQEYAILATYAGTSNQSGMKIYIDSNLEATGASSAISSTILNNIQVAIGAESDGGSKMPNNSFVDDFQWWNVELDSDDALDLSLHKQINKHATVTNPAQLGYSDVS